MEIFIKLRQKQEKLLKYLKLVNSKYYKIKIDKDLSPIGWHLIHCLYVECIWIRSYFFQDDELANKLKTVADSVINDKYSRGLKLPNFKHLLATCEEEFKNNLVLLKRVKNQNTLSYFLNFLVNHHSQHLETINIIMNLINIKKNNISEENFSMIEASKYKFDPVLIKENSFKIGAKNKGRDFSFDNEQPEKEFKIEKFLISKKLIQIDEWLGFMESGGYKKRFLWSKTGWKWKIKNNIEKPLNWSFKGKRLSLSTPHGYVNPKKNDAVTNISFYEFEAFANWNNLKAPHEFEWEASYKKISNKFKVWEWSRNLFFPYDGFIAFPYKEYSTPWFNNNYLTLKGSSLYTEKEIKRKTFRNFYKPEVRYIFSGGRLCKV